jgi:hypothetical protein
LLIILDTITLKVYSKICIELNERKLIKNNDLTSYKNFDELELQISLSSLNVMDKELELQISKII